MITNEKIAEILDMDAERGRREVAAMLAANPDDDGAYYCLGRLLWKNGDRAGAMAAYTKAVALNPKSPASHALDLAHSVFDFFNPDLLNP